ncbi:hypothetical protein NDU88_004827 [Pleurodeles waltl]|uniref:Uncharacterized protein n=1 Tax=Pleurodeles waltl TaxID=8319 RepID=A0AAV7RIG2_PLEWA|nr:hypothetical protein NDU88_004827 [Pleurodeles waltl]
MSKCTGDLTVFAHLHWNRTIKQAYWQAIFALFSVMLEDAIDPDLLQALLGYVKPLNPGHRRFVDMALLLAKQRTTLLWRIIRTPTTFDWLKDMIYCDNTSQLYASLQRPRPKDIWALLRTYQLTQEPATTDNTLG